MNIQIVKINNIHHIISEKHLLKFDDVKLYVYRKNNIYTLMIVLKENIDETLYVPNWISTPSLVQYRIDDYDIFYGNEKEAILKLNMMDVTWRDVYEPTYLFMIFDLLDHKQKINYAYKKLKKYDPISYVTVLNMFYDLCD